MDCNDFLAPVLSGRGYSIGAAYLKTNKYQFMAAISNQNFPHLRTSYYTKFCPQPSRGHKDYVRKTVLTNN